MNKLYLLADLDPKTRPFQISNEEFARICYAYRALLEENPEIADFNYRAPKNKNKVIVEVH